MKKYFVGLDLGQASDSTALAIIERQERTTEVPDSRLRHIMHTRPAPPLYKCSHMERLPLGTRYPAIVEFVGKILNQPELRGQSTLVVDASGVGRPVCDLFTQAGLPHVAVTITGGDTINRDGNAYRVPKRVLVSTLQVLLQSSRLEVAPHALRETLIQELLNFQVTVNDNANDIYASRAGTHDDIVLAVALACWNGEHNKPGTTFVRPGLGAARNAHKPPRRYAY